MIFVWSVDCAKRLASTFNTRIHISKHTLQSIEYILSFVFRLFSFFICIRSDLFSYAPLLSSAWSEIPCAYSFHEDAITTVRWSTVWKRKKLHIIANKAIFHHIKYQPNPSLLMECILVSRYSHESTRNSKKQPGWLKAQQWNPNKLIFTETWATNSCAGKRAKLISSQVSTQTVCLSGWQNLLLDVKRCCLRTRRMLLPRLSLWLQVYSGAAPSLPELEPLLFLS